MRQAEAASSGGATDDFEDWSQLLKEEHKSQCQASLEIFPGQSKADEEGGDYDGGW